MVAHFAESSLYVCVPNHAFLAFLQKGLEVPVEEMPAPEAPSMVETVREMALKDYQIVKKVQQGRATFFNCLIALLVTHRASLQLFPTFAPTESTSVTTSCRGSC